MKYDIINPVVPKMPTLGKSTESKSCSRRYRKTCENRCFQWLFLHWQPT